MAEENGCGDGLCSLHSSEVERRRSYATEIDALKGRISELLSFKNKLIGFGTGIGVFATVVVLGSYTYTYNHTQEAMKKYEDLSEQTKKVELIADTLRREVSSTQLQLARTDERYQALQNQLRSIDVRLEQLLENVRKPNTK